MRTTRPSVLARFLACGLMLTPLGAAPARAQELDAPRHDAIYTRYAVAADQPLASAAGAEILAKGGNAVDAAVATSFALSVTRPFSCGIGGGGFMVIHLREHPRMRLTAEGLSVALNYRETCPAGVGPDYFEKLDAGGGPDAADASTHGGRAVAIPGTVAGLLAALEQYGTLDRVAVMAPAIRLAREGFAPDIAYAKAAAELSEKFEKQPGWKTRFAFAWERLLARGRFGPQAGAEGGGEGRPERLLIKLPEQAEVLEAIARDGVKAFYEGPIGAEIVRAIQADGGVMTAADLAGYAPASAEPLRFAFEGRTLLMMPPPSSGGLALAETLAILVKADYRQHVKDGFAPTYLQLLVESTKHAFADRAAWLGDPAFVDVPVARLLSPEYIAQRAMRMSIGRVYGPDNYGTRERPEGELKAPADDGGTSHFSIIDGAGNAVACTETINLEFGSLVAVRGFCLNNQMDDFTTRRGRVNALGLRQSDRNLPAPGKRPLSSMTPTIVLGEGKAVEAVLGGSGGPRIITATTQVLLNTLVLGYDAPKALAAPRFHHQWMPNVLELDRGFEEIRWNGMRVVDWMRKQKHQVSVQAKVAAVQLVVRRPDGTLQAGCDPRKGGAPAGE